VKVKKHISEKTHLLNDLTYYMKM